MPAVLSRLVIVAILAAILISSIHAQAGKPPSGPHTGPCTPASIPLPPKAYPLAWVFPGKNDKGQLIVNYILTNNEAMKVRETPDQNIIFNASFVTTRSTTNINLRNDPQNYSAKKKLYIYQLFFPHFPGPHNGAFQYYLKDYESCDVDIPGLRVRRNGLNPGVNVNLYAID